MHLPHVSLQYSPNLSHWFHLSFHLQERLSRSFTSAGYETAQASKQVAVGVALAPNAETSFARRSFL